MNIYEFRGTNYQVGNGVTDVEVTNIDTMPGKDLVTLFNLLRANVGIDKRVAKFTDKKTALKRVGEALAAYRAVVDAEEAEEAGTETETPPAPKAKKERKPRGMRFVFKPEPAIRECKGSIKTTSGDTRTLRKRAVDALIKGRGATFAEMKDLVTQFDKERDATTKNLERRTYELIRLVHYYLGYGLRQDEKSGKIFAYTVDN